MPGGGTALQLPWRDLLTAYNGNPITYDAIGNPIRVVSSATWGYNLTWQGRSLMSYDGYGENEREILYTYNADGIRTNKTVNGVTHNYVLNGNQVMAEQWEDKTLVYLYDESGSPFALGYRDDSYADGVYTYFFFVKNLQGDILAIYNGETLVGSYTYDAWGNCSVSAEEGITALQRAVLTTYNPFRYRGYFYDVETELYYLQSRYYNPEWCRFISPDAWDVTLATPGALTDKNLFAYCDNNPVMRVDGDGEFWNVLIGGAVGAVVGAISTKMAGGSTSEVWVSVACGFVSGAFAATGLGGVVGQIAVGAITSAIDTGYQNYNDYISGEKSLDEAVIGTLIDTAIGASLSAVGFEGTSAFKESNKMAKSTHTALKNLSKKSLHPTAKRAAQTALKKSRKYIYKTTGTAIRDGLMTEVAGYGMGKLLEFYY